MGKRKSYLPEFKAKVALEAIKELICPHFLNT
jgi:hypothetical protein